MFQILIFVFCDVESRGSNDLERISTALWPFNSLRFVVNIPVAFSGVGYRWRQEGDFEAKYHGNTEEGYLFPEYGPAML
jgi:hypothetical protein